MFQKIESPLAKLEISYAETLWVNTAVLRCFVNRRLHVFFFSTSDIKKLGKIHQRCWKERLKISKMAKFECYLLKTNADIASQTREFLGRLYVGGKFVPPYPTTIQTYVKFSSLV